jgi:tetratricopeptide (TPR) repeat protein
MNTSRSEWRHSWWLFACAACLSAPPFLCGETPKELTTQQQEQLKERNRLLSEAQLLRREGKLIEAIAAAEKMRAIERQVYGDIHAVVVESLEWLAGMHQQREDFAAASKARQEALAIRIKQHGAEDWRVTDARLALADVNNLARMTHQQRRRLTEAYRLGGEVVRLSRQGRFREAVDQARQVVEICKQVLGEKHPVYATSLNNLAELYRSQSDYARAEPLCRQATEIYKQALGEKHPSFALSLNNLATLYLSQGDYAKAEPLLRQAVEIYKQALGEKHPSYATSLNNLAQLYKSQGDYTRAEPLFRQALSIRKQTLGEKHPDYAASLNNLAGLYHSQGDYAKAEPLFRQALETFRQALGEKHPDRAASLNNLASLYHSQATTPGPSRSPGKPSPSAATTSNSLPPCNPNASSWPCWRTCASTSTPTCPWRPRPRNLRNGCTSRS